MLRPETCGGAQLVRMRPALRLVFKKPSLDKSLRIESLLFSSEESLRKCVRCLDASPHPRPCSFAGLTVRPQKGSCGCHGRQRDATCSIGYVDCTWGRRVYGEAASGMAGVRIGKGRGG